MTGWKHFWSFPVWKLVGAPYNQQINAAIKTGSLWVNKVLFLKYALTSVKSVRNSNGKIPAKLTTDQIDCPFVVPFMKLCKVLPAKL